LTRNSFFNVFAKSKTRIKNQNFREARAKNLIARLPYGDSRNQKYSSNSRNTFCELIIHMKPTCSIGMQQKCTMDMLNGHTAWTCSVGMQHGHAA
jgi:hypothetical protein